MNIADQGSNSVSRRTIVTSALAAAAIMNVDEAAAQRCPADPPKRERGPAVWLGMDQKELDDAYNQSVYAFNARNISERRDAGNRIALSVIGKGERFAYGPSPIEGVDVWRAKKPNAPVLIFIHGGGWRGNRSADFAVYAEPYVNSGVHFVAVDFSSVVDTGGDLFPLVDQCRRAVAWVYRNATTFGGNPEAIYLCSRSSGSHLAGCVLITDWEKHSIPSNVIKSAIMGSGMYDLKPVRQSSRSRYVKITDEAEQQLSAMRHIDKVKTPVVLSIGTLETPEFQRQSRDFAQALSAAGKPVELIVGGGYNHYEMGETIGHPYQMLGRAVMKTIGLSG